MNRKFKKWSREEDDYIRKYYGKIPVGEIAKKLQRTVSGTTCHAIRALGLHSELRGKRRVPDTICWDCGKYTRCSWARRFKPVKGWTAIHAPIEMDGGRAIDSYSVVECPEFVNG